LIHDQLHFYHYTLPQQNNFDSIKKKISDREESKYIAHVFRGGGYFIILHPLDLFFLIPANDNFKPHSMTKTSRLNHRFATALNKEYPAFYGGFLKLTNKNITLDGKIQQ